MTVVAELLSALSIIAAAGLYMYDHAWAPNQTDLSAHIAKSSHDTLSLYLSNEGGTDAVVTSMHITSDALEGYKAAVKIPKTGLLIEHGKSMLISSGPTDLSAVVKTASKLPSGVSTTHCTLTLNYIDSKGNIHEDKLRFDCYAACVFADE